jgi:predicted flap endonuclease-1-like 5' DNA nuclease
MFEQNITLGPGTGTFASHTFEILVMLLGAFLLGLWLGWVLWAKYKQLVARLQTEKDSLQASLSQVNVEMHALKDRFAYVDRERAELQIRVQALDQENSNLRATVVEVQEDLGEVESLNRQLETELALVEVEVAEEPAAEVIDEIADVIDPVTEVTDNSVELELTSEEIVEQTAPIATNGVADASPGESFAPPTAGIDTTPPPAVIEAATTTPDRFKFVMEDSDGGDLESMSLSRSVAARPMDMESDDHFADHHMEALTRVSAAPTMETGLESSGDSASEPIVILPITQDDLKVVEGIGPKIEELLFKAGIFTYSELAAAPVSRLREILTEAGPRFAMHDPGTWSAQSLLAANGEWENLKAYQDFLDAGKRPEAKG